MRPDLQQEFIAAVTDASYDTFRNRLDDELGVKIGFRVCEMPVFVSHDFRRQLEHAAIELVQQCSSPSMLARTDAMLDPSTTVRNEPPRPLFSVVDFAVTQDEHGTFVPRLIELQGFPSLFGYQYLLADRYRTSYGIHHTTPFFGDLHHDAYVSLLKNAIYADADPQACVLMEVAPETQKTLPDFRAMEKLIGLRTVDIRDVYKDGRHLVVRQDGKLLRIERIFNRAIVDELADLDVKMQFGWTDDLAIEWAGHPNWYFRMSKAVMPWLQHPTVPETVFLDESGVFDGDLNDYVLKPLFAFAGKGVELHPTQEHIDAIPVTERPHWVLQRKVAYASCIATPFGMNRVELRVMLVWPEGASAPVPAMSLARTGRGELMGARYNTAPWTGSSGCLFV